jgi:hypothetical protein
MENNMPDLIVGGRVKIDFDSLKCLAIAHTDTDKCALIIKSDDSTFKCYTYGKYIYDALEQYTYFAQEASLLYNRAFSTEERLSIERREIRPSTMKEIVSEKILLEDGYANQNTVKYNDRNIPIIWTIESIQDKNSSLPIKQISKADFRIMSNQIFAVIRHIEDDYYLVFPMRHLKHEWS